MLIKSQIKIGNNVTLAPLMAVDVETTCHGFITLKIPLKDATVMELELDRMELREFLARTNTAFQTTENYAAKSV